LLLVCRLCYPMSKRTRKRKGTKWSSCEKKQSYESKESAEAGRQHLIKNRGVFPGRIHVYRCRYGKHWHVGGKW